MTLSFRCRFKGEVTMRYQILAAGALALSLVSHTVFAAEFPSVKVARMVAPSVVSIDINSVAYGSVMGAGGGGEFARTGALSTKHMTGFVLTESGYIVTDSSDLEGATLIS